MAIKLLGVNGEANERIVKYIVDTEDEKNDIPAGDKVFGTEVEVVASGKSYRMGSDLIWVEVITGSGESSSSLPTGVLDITSNGVKNVTNYAYANVNVAPTMGSVTVDATSGKLLVEGGIQIVNNEVCSVPTLIDYSSATIYIPITKENKYNLFLKLRQTGTIEEISGQSGSNITESANGGCFIEVTNGDEITVVIDGGIV